MSYACAEKYSSEVRDRSEYRERIVSALQLLDPQKVKEIVKAKSEENKAIKQAQKEAKKQARQAQKEAYKFAKEQEKAQKLSEKEIQREMRILEKATRERGEKQQKSLKKEESKYPYLDAFLDPPVETKIVRVKRINAEGKHVAKGTPGGDYLLDTDNTVYCANKREYAREYRIRKEKERYDNRIKLKEMERLAELEKNEK